MKKYLAAILLFTTLLTVQTVSFAEEPAVKSEMPKMVINNYDSRAILLKKQL